MQLPTFPAACSRGVLLIADSSFIGSIWKPFFAGFCWNSQPNGGLAARQNCLPLVNYMYIALILQILCSEFLVNRVVCPRG